MASSTPRQLGEYLSALRSGRFDQHIGRELRNLYGDLSAAGLLCHLAAPGCWRGTAFIWVRDMGPHGLTPFTFDCTPPDEVLDRFNLDRLTVWRIERMNEAGRTFTEIAEWLEHQLATQACFPHGHVIPHLIRSEGYIVDWQYTCTVCGDTDE